MNLARIRILNSQGQFLKDLPSDALGLWWIATRSKLEKHPDVLEALVAKPLESEIMSCQVDQEWEVIKKHLDFLIAKRLVERLPLGRKRVVYSVTERGLEVLEALEGTECGQQLDQLLLVYEE